MKLLIFLICESLAGLKSSAGNIKVQEECNANIRKSRAKLTHVGTSSQDGISSIGTMQNRFLNLDNFFICLAYDDLMVGISDGTNCF